MKWSGIFVPDELKKYVFNREKIVYAGKYLGKAKKEFVPSFLLLDSISLEKVNKVSLDEKSAWLFVCGRDIFEDKLLKVEGKLDADELFLVMLEDRCIGYGKVDLFEGKKILKNLLDRGDFLRREK